MLPIAMLTGASIYLIYRFLPALHFAGPFLGKAAGILQPTLIFLMLFLTFCRIEPSELKPHRWHWWLLAVQGCLFAGLGLAAYAFMRMVPEGDTGWLVLVESAMLCFICPTATAAAVVTRKLGGDVAGITTYTILINILTAFLVPLVVPMVRPVETMSFWVAFSMIIAKIFPLLIMPCLLAWMIRYMAPKLHRKLLKYPDLPFYLWSVGLALAIAVTTRSIANSSMPVLTLLLIGLISLLCCILQFAVGRFVGSRYRPRRSSQPQTQERGKRIRKVTAGQSLGQKNTIFAIWMGYTFMTPETSIVGGLYSIWHNLYNSWQLYKAGK